MNAMQIHHASAWSGVFKMPQEADAYVAAGGTQLQLIDDR